MIQIAAEIGSLPVAGRSIAFFVGRALADEFPVLGAPELSLALEVIDVRPGVDPNQLVIGPGHSGWRLMQGRLSHRGGRG
jgi:hypothetical protein